MRARFLFFISDWINQCLGLFIGWIAPIVALILTLFFSSGSVLFADQTAVKQASGIIKAPCFEHNELPEGCKEAKIRCGSINFRTFPDEFFIQTSDYGVSLYGIYFFDNLSLEATGSYHIPRETEQTRNLPYPVSRSHFNHGFPGKTDADEYSVSLCTEYTFNQNALSFGPYTRAKYSTSGIDGYSEKFPNPNQDSSFPARKLQNQNIKSFSTTIGGQIAYAVSTTLGVLAPYLRLEWEHEFEDDTRKITAPFEDFGIEQYNIIFIPTEDPDRDFFNLELGFSAAFPHGVFAFVDYETILGLEDLNLHKFSAGLKFEF